MIKTKKVTDVFQMPVYTDEGDYFGDVEETGIMVTINDIYEKKAERHIASYK